jgi:hypothetical protein
MKMVLKTCLLAAGVLAIGFTGLSLLSGVKVKIVNLGPFAMRSVSVDVTGASYSVGDIPAGTSKWVKVQPGGESAVSIKHLAKTGKQRALFVDCYIEGGYSGKIIVQVKNEKIIHVKQDIKLTPIG